LIDYIFVLFWENAITMMYLSVHVTPRGYVKHCGQTPCCFSTSR